MVKPDPTECMLRGFPICPECGVGYDGKVSDENGDEDRVACHECGKEFLVSTTVLYSTRSVTDPE